MTSFINNDVASGDIVKASDHNTQGALIAAVVNGNIDANNLASNAVTTAKIADSNVTTAKIADAAVTSAKIDFTTSGNVWWQELNRTTLGSNNATLSVSFTAKKYLRVLVSYAVGTGTSVNGTLRINGDSTAIYATNSFYNNSGTPAFDTTVSQTGITAEPFNMGAGSVYIDISIYNPSTASKIITGNVINDSTTAASTAPQPFTMFAKYVSNTQATSVSISASGTGTPTFATGSQIIVLGHD